MPTQVMKKLFRSFEELEQSLEIAKKSLAAKDPIPLEVIRRINTYEDILLKQRTLAKKLCQSMVAGDWEQVARHVRLINGFSSMLQEDAAALVKDFSGKPGASFADEDELPSFAI